MTPPESQRPRDAEEADAFLAVVLRIVQWMRENTRAVVIGAVVLFAGIAAAIYYQNYREDVRQQAASQLQQLQTQLQAQSSPDTLARSIEDYISRFGDTRYGDEARLLMARIHLTNGAYDRAIGTLESVTGSYPADVPTGYAARKLLAAAHESAGNPEEALQLYADLAENAQFPFQRNDAAASRARLLARRGRLAEAESIYARLVSEADTSAAGVASEELQNYRLKLGEIRARLAGDGGGSAAGDAPPGGEAPSGADSTGAGAGR